MKNTLIIFLIGLPFVNECQAQDYDSLKQKIVKMDIAINNIHYNMLQSHKEFRAGTFLLIAGTALTIAGTIIRKDRDGSIARDNNNSLIHIGAGILTIGTIVQIDSHRWIGKGARRKRIIKP